MATTNLYNSAGDLSTVFYTDGTPGVTNGFDRLGRTIGVTNGASVCAFAYNDAGLLLREAYLSGPLSGLILTNGYDALLRRTALALSNQPTTLVQFGYDNASRLSAVTNGTSTVAYGYLANSPLVNALTFAQSGATRMTATNRYDNLNRLAGKSSVASGGAAFNFDYSYNTANQRTAVTNADNSRWSFGYDTLGQVTSGKKYWSDATPVAGQQFEYAFDDIGNRQSASFGGDQYGANLRLGNYTNNLLNQIIARSVPGYVNIMGTATNTATVTVNNQPTYRKGDYFRSEMVVTNGSGPVQAWFTNLAVLNDGTNADIVASSIGNVLVPPAVETIGYDLDGNITNDGRWVFQWDAENRVTNIESHATVPVAAKRKIALQYDYAGRLVRRTEYDGSSGSYSTVLEDIKFVSDGWRCLAELKATNNALLRSYVWGLDLSGTIGGAGGVGGLLAMNTATNGTHFYAYDGNGNVAGLVSAADGSESARYEYEPFGALLRATGLLATENAYGFSTKRRDKTTDILHYEFRIYLTWIGTWGSRDPIGHLGGKNEYAFCGNDAVRRTDSFGYWAESGHFYTTYIVARMTGLYDADAAYRLAFSSQHPDEAPGYDAIQALSVLLGSPEWSRMIQEELHSLHGGDAKKRRACLQLVVSGKCGGTLKDWERGFVIHAFGDSFAHTQPNGNNYKFPLGHAKDMHEPDTISADPKKYLESLLSGLEAR